MGMDCSRIFRVLSDILAVWDTKHTFIINYVWWDDSLFKLVLVAWPAVLPVDVSDFLQNCFFFLGLEFCLKHSRPGSYSVLEAGSGQSTHSSLTSSGLAWIFSSPSSGQRESARPSQRRYPPCLRTDGSHHQHLART